MARNLSHNLKRVVAGLCAVLVVAGAVPTQPIADIFNSTIVASAVDGLTGSGTETDPFLISSIEDLDTYDSLEKTDTCYYLRLTQDLIAYRIFTFKDNTVLEMDDHIYDGSLYANGCDLTFNNGSITSITPRHGEPCSLKFNNCKIQSFSRDTNATETDNNTIVLNNCEVGTIVGTRSSYCGAAFERCQFTINNCTFHSYLNIQGVVNAVINGGIFEDVKQEGESTNTYHPGWAVSIAENSTVTINGGTFTAQSGQPVLSSSGGSVEVKGGTFNGDYLGGIISTSTTMPLAISGGTFNTPTLWDTATLKKYNSKIEASFTGGTFNTTSKPDTSYLAEGYRYAGSGPWTVLPCIQLGTCSSDGIADQVYNGSAIEPDVAIYDYENRADNPKLVKGTDYTLAYSGDHTSVTDSPVTVTVTGKGDYTGTFTKTFDIVKADAKLTKKPSAKNPKYNGEYQDLINTGTCSAGCTLYYRLQTSEGWSEWMTTSPQAKERGIYTIEYYIKGNDNYNDTEVTTITSELKKGTIPDTSYIRPTQTASTKNLRLIYDPDYELIGTKGEYTGTELSEGTPVLYFVGRGSTYSNIENVKNLDKDGSIEWSEELPTCPDYAGTTYYYLCFKIKSDNDNYDDVIGYVCRSTATSATYSRFCVNQKGTISSIVAPGPVENLYYNGKEQALVTAGGSPEGTTFMYCVTDDSVETAPATTDAGWSEDIPTATQDGTYKVWYYVAGGNNYKDYTPNNENFVEAEISAKLPVDIAGAEVYLDRDQVGSADERPGVDFILVGDEYIDGTDLDVTYGEVVNGVGTVTVTPKEGVFGFIGSATTTYVVGSDIRTTDVTLDYTTAYYTGDDIEPGVTVRLNGRLLTKDEDYTVVYENNRDVGQAAVKIVGNSDNNVAGTKTVSFTIEQKPVSDCDFEPIADQDYTGTALIPSLGISNNGHDLVKGTDFVAFYSGNTNPGTASVLVIGQGNYTGRTYVYFDIKGDLDEPEQGETDYLNAEVSSVIPLNDEGEITTANFTDDRLSVTFGGKRLTLGTDFAVSAVTTDPDTRTGTVTIEGVGKYKGTRTLAFSYSNATQTLTVDSAVLPYITVLDSDNNEVIGNGGVFALTVGERYTVANNTRDDISVQPFYILTLNGADKMEIGKDKTASFEVVDQVDMTLGIHDHKGTLSLNGYCLYSTCEDGDTDSTLVATFRGEDTYVYGDAIDLEVVPEEGYTDQLAVTIVYYNTATGARVTGDELLSRENRQAGTGYRAEAQVVYNNTTYYVTRTFTIVPRELTLTPDPDQGKTYGEADPVIAYTITEGTMPADDDTSFSAYIRRSQTGEAAGEYGYELAGDTDASGSLTVGSFIISLAGDNKFTIEQKTIDVDFGDITMVETDNVPGTVSREITDEVTGDIITAEATVDQPADLSVGEHDYTVSGTTLDNTNYRLGNVSTGKLIVTEADFSDKAQLIDKNTVAYRDFVVFNFLAEITDDSLTEGAYVVFTYNHYGEEKTLRVNIDTSPAGKNGNYYRFSCPLTASEMTVEVTAELYVHGQDHPVSTRERTIKDYSEAVIAGTDDENERALAQALLNYGGYTQVSQGLNTDELAYEGYLTDVSDVEITSAIDFVRPTEAVDGISYYGTSGMFVSAPFNRHYFAVEEGHDITEYTFEINGVKKDPILNTARYYIDSDPDKAYEMDNVQNVVVKKGDEVIMSYSYSMVTYLSIAAEKGNENTKNQAKAMYSYYIAAKAFVEGNS